MLVNLHSLKTKTANNLVMDIGTIMIFGGIIESDGPINTQEKCCLRNFRCQSKSGITGFFKHLHYSIYTSHLNGGRRVMSDSPLYNITCAATIYSYTFRSL